MEYQLGQIRGRSSELYDSVFQKYQTIVKDEKVAASGSVLANCIRVLENYWQRIQQRPKNTCDIEFWKGFVAEFYAEDARVGICMSAYDQTISATPQKWKKSCSLCQTNAGFGFEFSKEFLPELLMFVHAIGKMHEHYLRMEHAFSCKPVSGPTVLKSAIIRRETVYQERLLLRAGRLNISFNPDMKICAVDFCACDDHEPQVDGNIRYHLGQETASSSADPNIVRKALFRALQGSDALQFMLDLMKFTTKHGTPPPETMAMGTSTWLSDGVLHAYLHQSYFP